jgi:sodium transport system permease protein
VSGIKEKITNKEDDLLLVFPEDFDALVAERNSLEPTQYLPPDVEIYYNSTRVESSAAFAGVAQLLDAYKTALTPSFTVNRDPTTSFDLVTDKDEAGFTLGMMLPLLIILLTFSGCMGIAPESIAGEKERGTMATMLITPLARWELALGKIVSLGIISLLSGLSSFIGIILTLPSMMMGSANSSASVATSLYGLPEYAMLLVVTLSTVLVFIGLISVVSAYARTVKEATTLVTPLMIVVMLVAVLGAFSQGAATDLLLYLIPVYNSAQCLNGVFTFTALPLAVAITVAVNLLLTALCVFALTKMFNSEKILFGR